MRTKGRTVLEGGKIQLNSEGLKREKLLVQVSGKLVITAAVLVLQKRLAISLWYFGECALFPVVFCGQAEYVERTG